MKSLKIKNNGKYTKEDINSPIVLSRYDYGLCMGFVHEVNESYIEVFLWDSEYEPEFNDKGTIVSISLNTLK